MGKRQTFRQSDVTRAVKGVTIDTAKARLRERVERLVRAMPALNDLRATMIAGRIARQTADCPFCAAPGRMHVTCAIDINNHISARCAECGEGFIE